MTHPMHPDDPRHGLSRRAFIKGVIAAGATVSSAAYLFRGPAALYGRPSAAGTVERLVTLRVNGQLRHVDVLAQETLVMTLRYKLGLTGTKIGCDRGECGSCTVLIDGIPHYACAVLTHRVRGRDITTIEGLARPDGRLHPVQRGVVDELGFQCGFCAPGMILTAAAYLKAHPAPTRAELAEALSGVLCRCGDYDKILNGLMRGAAYARGELT